MPPAVVTAVLLSAVLHAGWNALLRQSTDRLWTAGWIGISTAIVCAPFLLYVGLPHGVWPFIFCSASLRAASLILLAQAYKLSELSFVYPIARGTSPVLITVGGLLVASEHPGLLAACGIVLIVAGLAVVAFESKNWDMAGLRLALFIGVVIGVYTILDGLGARRSGLPIQYNLWNFSIYGVMILIYKFATAGRRAFHGPTKDISLAFGGGAICVVSYAAITWAMVHASMGPVVALRESSTFFAVAIGVIFLRERFSVPKLAGCIAIVGGAIMIGLGK